MTTREEALSAAKRLAYPSNWVGIQSKTIPDGDLGSLYSDQKFMAWDERIFNTDPAFVAALKRKPYELAQMILDYLKDEE